MPINGRNYGVVGHLDMMLTVLGSIPIGRPKYAGSGMVATDESHDSEVNGENMDCCS